MIRSIEDKGGEEDKGKPCIPFYGIIGALLVVETPEPHLCRIALLVRVPLSFTSGVEVFPRYLIQLES